jgi:hypothetical protein
MCNVVSARLWNDKPLAARRPVVRGRALVEDLDDERRPVSCFRIEYLGP